MRRAHHDPARASATAVAAVMHRGADPRDWRLNCGQEHQPESMQGSTRFGYCSVCGNGPVPVEGTPIETARGPGGTTWTCCPCFRKLPAPSDKDKKKSC